MGQALTVGILGALEVASGGTVVPLTSRKQRLVLIRLVIGDGPVSEDVLLEVLWGQQPPSSALSSLRAHVSRLRSTLQQAPAAPGIDHGPGGYSLVGDLALDATDFESTARSAEAASAASDPVRARAHLVRGLALWRGEALADFRYEPFAQPLIARLEALRLNALEDRIALDLELDRDTELVPELEELVRAHPLRERLHWLLMLALHRAERTADALDAYQEARRIQLEELGIEPSRSLRSLQHSILRGIPTPVRSRLAPEVPTDVAPDGPSGIWQRVTEGLPLGEVEDSTRCELLLAQGHGLRLAGRIDEGKRAYAAAVRLADTGDRPEQLARAVLGLVGPPEDSLSMLPLDEPLIERALLRLTADRPAVARLRARLAVGLIDRGQAVRGRELLTAARDVADRTGDARTIAYVIRARQRIWFQPEELDARLAASDELLEIGRTVGDVDIQAWAHRWRMIGRIEAADLPGATAEIDQLTDLIGDGGDAFHHWFVATRRAGLALLRDPIEESEAALHRALAVTDRINSDYTSLAGLMLLWTSRWLRGDHAELLELTTRVEALLPAPMGLTALVHAEHDQRDRVREAFDAAVSSGLDALLAPDHIGVTRLLTLAALGEAAAYLTDEAWCDRLHRALLPFSGRLVVVPPGVSALTSVDHVLASLAAARGQLPMAERHFRAALALCNRSGAAVLHRRTEHACSRMLAHQPRGS